MSAQHNTVPHAVQRQVIEAQCHHWLIAIKRAQQAGQPELARRCVAMANYWLGCFEAILASK